MNSPSYQLLENEGNLIQGCLMSALATLRRASGSERRPLDAHLYVAFFNYSIGLERLLKVILALDFHLDHKGGFPGKADFKRFGHRVQALYEAAKSLLPKYKIVLHDSHRPDEFDTKLVEFFDSFADGGRYFNLDALSGNGGGMNPLQIWHNLMLLTYKNDVHELMRISNEEQVDALAAELKGCIIYVPEVDADGKELTYEEWYQGHGRLPLVLPAIVWRLVKILVPLHKLVYEMGWKLQEDQDVPVMDEFLNFVGEDQQSTIGDADWLAGA